MPTPAILAIDEGTTGVTCLVITVAGEIVGRAYSEFEQHFPRPGWVEHDASEIWTVTQRLAREAVAGAPLAWHAEHLVVDAWPLRPVG